MKVVADSHVLVVYLAAPARLTEAALEALRDAEDTDGIAVSAATIADLWYASQKTSSPAVAPGVFDQIRSTVLDPTTNLRLQPITAATMDHFDTVPLADLRPRSTASSSPPRYSSTYRWSPPIAPSQPPVRSTSSGGAGAFSGRGVRPIPEAGAGHTELMTATPNAWTVELDPTPGRSPSQEEFLLHRSGADGDTQRIVLHDYATVYAVPGLYEEVVQRRLECASPATVASALAEAAGERITDLRAFDLGRRQRRRRRGAHRARRDRRRRRRRYPGST